MSRLTSSPISQTAMVKEICKKYSKDGEGLKKSSHQESLTDRGIGLVL